MSTTFQSFASVSRQGGLQLDVAPEVAPLQPGTRQNGVRPVQPADHALVADLMIPPEAASSSDYGIRVSEGRYAPGFISRAMRRDFSEFQLVTGGRARLEAGGRVFQLAPGSLVHTPAGRDYDIQDGPGHPVVLYTIRYCEKILPARLSWQLNRLGILHWDVYRSESPLLRTVPSICREMLHEQHCRQAGWETVLMARLADLVVRVTRYGARQASQHEPSLETLSDSVARVGRYAARLRSQFHLSTTLDEAAQATGLSRRRFTALFRSITGQSWHKYLLGLRLDHARWLLSHTDKSILSVAFESGFDDLSHFNHVFRQAVGCSPSAFRAGRPADPRQPARPPVAAERGQPVTRTGVRWAKYLWLLERESVPCRAFTPHNHAISRRTT